MQSQALLVLPLQGFNPLHLACFGGHMSVVGLLLSRSAELLQSCDRYGKTGLHIAAMHGHYQMVEILLGQGAEINAADKNGWTPLHCAAKAGHLEVVKLLCESGASPKNETNYGCAPIWFAASEGHNNVLKYLMHKEHDTYALMEDKRFVYNLMVVSKNNNNKPIEEFILVSPAPVDAAAKLSNIYMILSTKVRKSHDSKLFPLSNRMLHFTGERTCKGSCDGRKTMRNHGH